MLLKDKIALLTGCTGNMRVGTALPVDGGRLNAMSNGRSR